MFVVTIMLQDHHEALGKGSDWLIKTMKHVTMKL
jgi:hypothetical protein